MTRHAHLSFALMSLVALASGPALAGGDSKAAAAPAPVKGSASVVLEPTQGSQVRGTVTFTPAPGGVRVVADITGLTPGAHGFHVHDKGDCSAPDATSAGGHFNPGNAPHGAPDARTARRTWTRCSHSSRSPVPNRSSAAASSFMAARTT
jgi:Cu-Zn family superoxide dismutase